MQYETKSCVDPQIGRNHVAGQGDPTLDLNRISSGSFGLCRVGRYSNPRGRVGSDQKVYECHRSGRAGLGEYQAFRDGVGWGEVTLTRPDTIREP